MRNNTAHFHPYHFQYFSSLLGLSARRVQYNAIGQVHFKDQKGHNIPQDLRHLQTACFESPIYMDFFT